MIGLTPKQARCLDAIKRLTAAGDGVSPSYTELSAEMGLAGKGGLAPLLHRLHERGAISFTPHLARSIRVLEDPADLTGLEERTSEHLRAIRTRCDEILRGRAQ